MRSSKRFFDELRCSPSTDQRNATMSCRIDRVLTDENLIVLIVTGRIAGEHVETLRRLLEQEVVAPVVDLQNVHLVDREAVELLASIEAKGTELRNCPMYVREWVTRERRGTGRLVSPEVSERTDDIEERGNSRHPSKKY
jgi:hypothetical protein